MKSKVKWFLFFLLAVLVWPVFMLLAQTPVPTVPAEPQTVDQAVGLFQTIIAAAKDGQWLVLVAAIVNIMVFSIKKWGDWLKIPSAWRVPVITGLGLAVAIIAHLISGEKWTAAWVLSFLAGPVSVWVHQLIIRFKNEPEVPPTT